MERLREPHEPDHEREQQPAAAPAPAQAPVLELQRTAGNAAVAALLGSAPAAVARKRKLDEAADTLEEIAPAAKDMEIDTTDVALGPAKDWVDASRGQDRDGIDVDIRMGAPMDGQKRVAKALSAIGMTTFRLRADDKKAKKAPLLDTVRFANLDFTPYGGTAGHFRFTCVTAAPAQGKQSARVWLIVELVRPERPPLKRASELDRAARNELDNRFAKFGFVKAEPSINDTEPVETWLEDPWVAVLQALQSIPDATLASVPGIRWVRGHGKQGPTGEGGFFAYGKKDVPTLTLYDGAFTGSDDALVSLVAHELGHALSMKPPSKQGAASAASSKAYKDAVKADGSKAITAYGGTHAEEGYAEAYSMFITEPETMRVLRPNLFAYFTANPTGAPAGSPKRK